MCGAPAPRNIACFRQTDVLNTEWEELHTTAPYYLFVPQCTEHKAEYEAGWEISDIFQEHSVGFVTSRDKLTIHRTEEAVRQTVADFVSLSDAEARQKYRLKKDSRDWKVRSAQADLRAHCDEEDGHFGTHYLPKDEYIARASYRPFDTRFTYYTGQSRGFHSTPARKIMHHLLTGENLALCMCHGVKSPVWQHVWITNCIAEKSCVSNKSETASHVFPLYLYPHPEELEFAAERSLNLTPAFLKALSEKLALPQIKPFGLPDGISPEDILAYIYAVLHSPSYRERYIAFLKYDFPRIPVADRYGAVPKTGRVWAHLNRRAPR